MTRDRGDRRNVLVVDDSFIMRRLVTEIVESDPDLTVCGTAENGKVALAMVRSLKPDVVLLDIEMPEMSGLETLRRLGLRSPSKVIILSSLVEAEDAVEREQALKLGAFAAVGKPSGAVSMNLREHRSSDIVAAIRRAVALPPLGDPAPPAADDDLVGPLMALGAAAVLVFGTDGRLQAFNSASQTLFVAPPLVIGLRHDDIFDDFNAPIADRLREALHNPDAALDEETDLVTPAGNWVPLRLTTARSRSGALVAQFENLERERRMKALLERTLSTSVAESMMAASATELAGTTCEATILFADLRNFTSLSEALGPAGIVALLNEYFSFMADVVRAHDGIIDKYIGDAIMAVFGVPRSKGDDPDRAVEAAQDMLRALDIFNESRIAAGAAPLRIGIGLATGPVVAGAIGSPDRLNFTVIGDAVNLAARLESQTKAYGAAILACGETIARATRRTTQRQIDLVTVVGQRMPAAVHEISPRGTGPAAAKFARAFDLYAKGAFAKAAAAFAAVRAADPQDAAAAQLQARCEALAVEAPSDWTGLWRLTEK